MRSNSPGGQSRGIIRRSTRTPGSRAVLVLGGRDRAVDRVAGQQAGAAGRQPRGEHPDRAARLERGAVALPGQQGDAERVLARLVPAVRQPVGIGGGGIAFTEVPRIHRHGSRTSIARVKWAIMAGVSTGPRPPPLSSVWLAKQRDRRALHRGRARRQRNPQRLVPGHPGIGGGGPVPHPDGVAAAARGAARRAARPAASWSGCRSPSHGARHTSKPAISGASAAASSSSRPASPASGSPSRITSAVPAPRARSAAAVSAVRRRCQHGRVGVAPVRALAVGDRHQPQPCARRGEHRYQAAGAEYLVVRVSGHHHGACHAEQGLSTWRRAARSAAARQPRCPRLCPARRSGCGTAAGRLTTRLPCSATQLAKQRQVTLGVMLAQVDGEIGDRAGVRFVVAERSGAQRPAGPGQHVGGDRLGQRPDPQRSQRALAVPVAGVRVDLVRRLPQRVPRRAQREVDGPQVRERVRADVAFGRGAEQRAADGACPAVPAGRHPGAAVAEAWPVDVPAWRSDRYRRGSVLKPTSSVSLPAIPVAGQLSSSG